MTIYFRVGPNVGGVRSNSKLLFYLLELGMVMARCFVQLCENLLNFQNSVSGLICELGIRLLTYFYFRMIGYVTPLLKELVKFPFSLFFKSIFI